MANVFFPKARARMGDAGLTWTSTTKKLMLLDATYTYDANDEFVSDVSAGAIVARSSALAGKTVSATGVIDADDVLFTALTGDQVVAAIVYTDTGSDATSTLEFFIDSFTAYTPVGDDILFRWPSGANKIAAITD